jgi:hypothetical protein
MIVVPIGVTGLVLVVLYPVLKVVSDHLSHRADLRALERLVTTNPTHAHLVTELVAAKAGNRSALRNILRRSPPTP